MKLLGTILMSQIYRECLLSVRKPLGLINPLMFFAMIALLFPFILPQEKQYLTSLIPGLIWISALFSYLLSMDRFFEADQENGTLEVIRINPFPLVLSVFAKTIAHWLLTGLPLTLIAPLLGYLTGLSEISVLTLSLLLGTPALSALGALLGAITISLASRGLLLAILLIPLSIPILIFGTGSILAPTMALSSASSLSFLAAISLTALLGAPFAAAAALRLN